MTTPINKLILNLKHFWKYWVRPVYPKPGIFCVVSGYRKFLRDWNRYTKISDNPLHFMESYPCLGDSTQTSYFDSHYFYQPAWATELIIKNNPALHLDIGSEVRFVGQLSRYLPVIYLDIRPLQAKLHGLACVAGDILQLPFDDNSVKSLSCLHVLEHIGLGRYGDHLNSNGTVLALRELKRVLEPGGNLYISLPVGRPRVNFNAHRVHIPMEIIENFEEWELVGFSGVKDGGDYVRDERPENFKEAEYACGFFHFRK